MNPESRTGIGNVRLAGAAVLTVMIAALGHASVAGDFWREGATLIAMPWGRVTLVEAYIGYALFGAWILRRERNARRSAAWIVALCTLGHVVSGVYVLHAAARASGDRERFWNGA